MHVLTTSNVSYSGCTFFVFACCRTSTNKCESFPFNDHSCLCSTLRTNKIRRNAQIFHPDKRTCRRTSVVSQHSICVAFASCRLLIDKYPSSVIPPSTATTFYAWCWGTNGHVKWEFSNSIGKIDVVENTVVPKSSTWSTRTHTIPLFVMPFLADGAVCNI